MAFWLDAAIVLLAVLFVVFGFRRGFVKSLVEMLGFLAAVIASSLLASAIAAAVYTGFVQEPLTGRIEEALTTVAGTDMLQKVLDALPNFVTGSLADYGITEAALGATIAGSAQTAAPAVAQMVAPIITDLMKTILTIVLFAAFAFLVKLLAKTVDRAFHLPLLKQTNALLGGAFGLVKCALFVLLVCAVLKLVIPMLETPPALFSRDTMEDTVLFRYAYDANPIYGLLQLF